MAKQKRSIGVFCGSSLNVDEAYREAAVTLGRELASRGHCLVYGGNNIGLMGLMADAALARGGEVVGVVPRFLVELEIAHYGVTELIVVETMHERKRTMAERADAFLVLPGGMGTLDEAIEIVTWRQLKLHDKPVVFLDIGGYWQPLKGLVDHFVRRGFADASAYGFFHLAPTVEAALAIAERPIAAAAGDDLERT